MQTHLALDVVLLLLTEAFIQEEHARSSEVQPPLDQAWHEDDPDAQVGQFK